MSDWVNVELTCEGLDVGTTIEIEHVFTEIEHVFTITHSQKNQLFIDSITHWVVDGVREFQKGHKLYSHMRWSDGSECKLTGSYCSLCEVFRDDHEACFLENNDLDICCEVYDLFMRYPSITNCRAVIAYLWSRAQEVCHRDYHIKISWPEYLEWREE